MESRKNKEIQDPFKTIFSQFNKFEILYRDMNNLGILGTQQEQESIHGILADLQKLLFDKPLKENAYQEIIHKISFLEDFVTNKSKSSCEKAAMPMQTYKTESKSCF